MKFNVINNLTVFTFRMCLVVDKTIQEAYLLAVAIPDIHNLHSTSPRNSRNVLI
jgi:hypothetical protein